MQGFRLIFCFAFCLFISISRPFPVGQIESRNQQWKQVREGVPGKGYLQTTSLDELPTFAVEKQQTTENAPSFDLNKQPSNIEDEPSSFQPEALNDYYQTEQLNRTPPPQDGSNDVSPTSDVIFDSPTHQTPVAVNESALEKFTNDVMAALTDSEGEDGGASTRTPTVEHLPQQKMNQRQVDGGKKTHLESDKGTTDGSVRRDDGLEKQLKQKEPSFLTDQTLKSPSSKESVLPEVNINTEVPLKEDPTRPPANKEFPVTDKRSFKSPTANMEDTMKGQIPIAHTGTKPRIEPQKYSEDDSTLVQHQNSGLESDWPTQIPSFQSTAPINPELLRETHEKQTTAAYVKDTLNSLPDDLNLKSATFPDFVSTETPSNYPSLLPQEHVFTRDEEIARMYTFPPPITAPDPQPFQPQQHEEVNPETADMSYDENSAALKPFMSYDAVLLTETK